MHRGRDHFILAAALVSLLLPFSPSAQPAPRIEPADVQRLAGAPWKGSLTYLDYTSRKPVSIASVLVVTRADADGRSWRFDYQYPDEPKANSASRVTIAGDGSAIIGDASFSRRKDVRFEGTEDYFARHTYSWTR